MRLDRLISILLILVEKKKVTGKELADYFEVSLRTIQRDINSLSTVGVPVYSDSGPNGGYRLLENYRLDKSFLKKNEASLLYNFIDSLYKTVPNESLKNIYHKFQVIKTQNQPVNNQHLQIQMNPWVEDEHLMTKLKAISKAIESNKRLMIEYLDLNNNKTSRVTEPYSLVVKESTWYLHAFRLAISIPFIVISPADLSSRVANILIRVVLPAPLGPSKPNMPFPIVKLIS